MSDEPLEAEEPLEADEADAAEQRLVLPQEDAADPAADQVRDDVNPADAAEQHRTVPLDEDDYR